MVTGENGETGRAILMVKELDAVRVTTHLLPMAAGDARVLIPRLRIAVIAALIMRAVNIFV